MDSLKHTVSPKISQIKIQNLLLESAVITWQASNKAKKKDLPTARFGGLCVEKVEFTIIL